MSAPLELRRDDIDGDGESYTVHLHGRYVGRVSRLSPDRARWVAGALEEVQPSRDAAVVALLTTPTLI